MEFLRELFDFIVFGVLGQAAILVGLISFVGLVLQKKNGTQILTGTVKTIAGFVIFGIGASAAQVGLTSFQTLFTKGFHVQGVMPLAEAVTGMAQGNFPTVIALIMVLGFAINLLVAKFTPFKNIFLTGQHNLYLAAMLTVMFKYFQLSDLNSVILGAVLLGLSAAIYPAIAQKYMKKITGTNDIAIGHYCTIAYALSGWIGSKVGNPEHSTESIKLPGFLSIAKDYLVSITVTSGILFYLSAFAAGRTEVEAISGGMNWLVYPLMLAVYFAGGLYVLITGVRLFIGEILPAFLGISEKLIPDSRPAVDCPVVFPYAPTAVVLGFISAYIAGILCMIIFATIGMTIIIPVAGPYFFIGGTAAVFANATGGWKGAIVGSFVTGILIAVGPAVMYHVFDNMGLVGSCFPETDFNFLSFVIYHIGILFQ